MLDSEDRCEGIPFGSTMYKLWFMDFSYVRVYLYRAYQQDQKSLFLNNMWTNHTIGIDRPMTAEKYAVPHIRPATSSGSNPSKVHCLLNVA